MKGIFFTLLSLVLAFYVTYKAIPPLIHISRIKGITDNPDEKRKIHRRKIPVLGGIGVCGGFLVACGVSINSFLPPYIALMMASLIILFFIGVKDDILVIDWKKKLSGEIIAASLIVVLGGVYVPGLDGLFMINSFPTYIGMAFSIFTIIIITNAFNLIDGVDGLAGTLSMVASLIFGIWFLAGGHYAEAIICFSLAGALGAFIYYNFEPAKIFLGDTGSLIIGFTLSVSAFRLMQLNPTTPGLMLNSPAIFAFSVMIIPMFDTLRVIIIRLKKRCSPMKPDKKHVHHYLLHKGLNHRQIVLLLGGFNIAVVFMSYFINSWNPHLYFITVTGSGILIFPLANLFRSAYSEQVNKPVPLPVSTKNAKFIINRNKRVDIGEIRKGKKENKAVQSNKVKQDFLKNT